MTLNEILDSIARAILDLSNRIRSIEAMQFTTACIKTTTGNPSYGNEGMICINTFDNNVKIYADGAWRTIASGW